MNLFTLIMFIKLKEREEFIFPNKWRRGYDNGLANKKIKEYLKNINKDDKNYRIMKKYLVIGNLIEHSLSPEFITFGLKKIILKQFMKRKN